MADPSRVLFLGMLGAYSRAVCESALECGVDICGVVVPARGTPGPLLPDPGRSSNLPILTPYLNRNIVHLAWERDLPVFATDDIAHTIALAALTPDVLAVACWPRLIRREDRRLVSLAVNVHPSLLPENRGPAPLFWTFRLGLRQTGVTVHVLEDRADAGAILAQRKLPVPDGIDGADLEMQLARAGGELLAEVVAALGAGTLQSIPQDESQATYQPAPAPEDWAIPSDWPQQRRLNFERGVAHLERAQQAG